MSHLPWHAIDLLHIKALIIFRTHIKIQITALSNSMTIFSDSYYLSVSLFRYVSFLLFTLSDFARCPRMFKQWKIYFFKYFELTQLQSAIRFLYMVLSVCRLSIPIDFFQPNTKSIWDQFSMVKFAKYHCTYNYLPPSLALTWMEITCLPRVFIINFHIM